MKTGASPLREEQVERYLDLARQQGYDAVITLSNDLVTLWIELSTPSGPWHRPLLPVRM